MSLTPSAPGCNNSLIERVRLPSAREDICERTSGAPLQSASWSGRSQRLLPRRKSRQEASRIGQGRAGRRGARRDGDAGGRARHHGQHGHEHSRAISSFRTSPPARIILRVTMNGFKTLKRPGVVVSPGDRLAVGGARRSRSAARPRREGHGETPIIQAERRAVFHGHDRVGGKPADREPRIRRRSRRSRPASQRQQRAGSAAAARTTS